MSERKIESYDRRAACVEGDGSDFVEVTVWANAEGFDAVVATKTGEQRFALTHEQWRALQMAALSVFE